jgi:hypothetical protein
VGYGLLAYHPNKVGNVIIAAGSPGGPDALLPPEPVTQSIARIAQNYTAMLPYLFPQGLKDEGEGSLEVYLLHNCITLTCHASSSQE